MVVALSFPSTCNCWSCSILGAEHSSQVSADLHKLPKNRSVAAGAFDCELCRVVEMAVNVAVVFMVRILLAEQCRKV